MNKEVETIFSAIREAGYIICKKEEFDELVKKATDDRTKKMKEDFEKLRETINKDYTKLQDTYGRKVERLQIEIDRLTKLLRSRK